MLATTTDEMVTLFRQDVDDLLSDDGTDTDRLWKTAECYRYLTMACDALARRTKELHSIVTVDVVAGTALYRLPPKVLHVREAFLLTSEQELTIASANRGGAARSEDYGNRIGNGDWRFAGNGTPTTFMLDYNAKQMRLVPTPVIDETLELQCSVTIATPMQEGMLLPFTEVEAQRLLLAYMKGQAYRKQDAETQDLQRAQGFELEYESGVSARDPEIFNRRNGIQTVAMDGWY